MGHLDAIRGFIRQVRREITAQTAITPWMRYMEIEIVEELLVRLHPRRCLEWGAGFSTLCFPESLDREATWLAVEHDHEWATKVDAMNERPNVRIQHVAANHGPWSDKHGDGAYSDLADYVDYPTAFALFDFVLVDGRARADCLERALELAAKTGVVVLHDAQRPYYHDALAAYEHQAWFRFYDVRASGHKERALWIGSTGVPIEKVLDVPRHHRIWRLYGVVSALRIWRLYAALRALLKGRAS